MERNMKSVTMVKGFVFLALAALVAVTLEVECDESYYNYLNLIDSKRVGYFWTTSLMEALENLHLEGGETPEAVLEKIRATAAESNEAHGKFYEQLLALADGEDHCTEEMLHQTKYLLGLIRTEAPDSVKKLAGYIQHYGLEKFEKCAVRAEKYMNVERRVEDSLDEYFKEAMSLTGKKLTDEELYEKLRAYDLTRDPINAAGLLKLAQRSKHKKDESNELLLRKLIQFRCEPFAKPLSTQHDLMNLAKALGSKHEFGFKFNKMNEYRRLCLSTKRANDLEAFRTNIEGALPEEDRTKPAKGIWGKIPNKFKFKKGKST